MAKLLIIYDPNDRIRAPDEQEKHHLGLKEAILAVPDDLEGTDIYAIARKLAELLLEQL